MEKPLPQNHIREGQTVYLVESCRRVREAVVLSRSGGLYTIRFTDTGGGIRVRADRLHPTRDGTAAQVRQQNVPSQLIRPGYWHIVPLGSVENNCR